LRHLQRCDNELAQFVRRSAVLCQPINLLSLWPQAARVVTLTPQVRLITTALLLPAAATPFPTPEGWQQLAVLNVTGSYANMAAQVPIGAVLKPAAGNTESKQLVVVLRGAAFKGDSAYSEYSDVLCAAMRLRFATPAAQHQQLFSHSNALPTHLMRQADSGVLPTCCCCC
jgi:hypothetical protein